MMGFMGARICADEPLLSTACDALRQPPPYEPQPCHICHTKSLYWVACPVTNNHRFCISCVEKHCALDFDILSNHTEHFWGAGCPICLGHCPCKACNRKRTAQAGKRRGSLGKFFELESLERRPGDAELVPFRRRLTEDDTYEQPPVRAERLEAPRLTYDSFTIAMFEEIVLQQRKPVILTGADRDFNKSIWTAEYLAEHQANVQVEVRYMLVDDDDEGYYQILGDKVKTMGWYVKYATDYHPSKVPGGDPDFEPEWHTLLNAHKSNKVVIYAKDFSFSEHISDWGADFERGLQSAPYILPGGPNDLLSCLPPAVRPVVKMGYIGTPGTRTPFHQDKLATVAFNLHLGGPGVKRWYLVRHSDAMKLNSAIMRAGSYLHRDDFWMDPEVLYSLEGVGIYCLDQHEGDMVLVPPEVPHQVINHGTGISFAVAANVVCCPVIDRCWDIERLYRARGVPSIYRLKAVIYYSLKDAVEKRLYERAKHLLPVFRHVVDEERLPDGAAAAAVPPVADGDEVPHLRVCNRCRTDLFNRRYSCLECDNDPSAGDGLDLCLQCYHRMTRNGPLDHPHGLVLVERMPFDELSTLCDAAKQLVGDNEAPTAPLPYTPPSNLVEVIIEHGIDPMSSDDELPISDRSKKRKQDVYDCSDDEFGIKRPKKRQKKTQEGTHGDSFTSPLPLEVTQAVQEAVRENNNQAHYICTCGRKFELVVHYASHCGACTQRRKRTQQEKPTSPPKKRKPPSQAATTKSNGTTHARSKKEPSPKTNSNPPTTKTAVRNKSRVAPTPQRSTQNGDAENSPNVTTRARTNTLSDDVRVNSPVVQVTRTSARIRNSKTKLAPSPKTTRTASLAGVRNGRATNVKVKTDNTQSMDIRTRSTTRNGPKKRVKEGSEEGENMNLGEEANSKGDSRTKGSSRKRRKVSIKNEEDSSSGLPQCKATEEDTSRVVDTATSATYLTFSTDSTARTLSDHNCTCRELSHTDEQPPTAMQSDGDFIFDSPANSRTVPNNAMPVPNCSCGDTVESDTTKGCVVDHMPSSHPPSKKIELWLWQCVFGEEEESDDGIDELLSC